MGTAWFGRVAELDDASEEFVLLLVRQTSCHVDRRVLPPTDFVDELTFEPVKPASGEGTSAFPLADNPVDRFLQLLSFRIAALSLPC